MASSKKIMFQVRDEDGLIRTVMATSHRNAARKFVDQHDPPPGEIDVKRRGFPSDDWQRFKVS